MVVYDTIWDVQSSLAGQQKNIEGHQVDVEIVGQLTAPKSLIGIDSCLKKLHVYTCIVYYRILQKYTLANLWLQTGPPLAEKQSVFHQ